MENCHVWLRVVDNRYERKKELNRFEIWCYRKMLKVKWSYKITNIQVLNRIGNARCLLKKSRTCWTYTAAWKTTKIGNGRNNSWSYNKANYGACKLWNLWENEEESSRSITVEDCCKPTLGLKTLCVHLGKPFFCFVHIHFKLVSFDHVL